MTSNSIAGDVTARGAIGVARWSALVVSATAAFGQSTCLPFGPLGFSPPDQCRVVAQADLNGDGHPDLVTAHFLSGQNVFVHLSDGAGGFLPPTGYESALQPNAVALGDMDLDGDIDIVLTTNHPSGQSVIIRRNDGTGGFSAPSVAIPLPASSGPIGLLLSDLDLDNDLDVVFAKSQGFTLSVMLNVGGASLLAAPTAYAVPAEVRAIDEGDFDGDGDDDIVCAGSNGVVVMRNNDAGAFNSVMANLTTISGGESVAAGDIDNDGDIDIAFSRTALSVPANRGVAFWVNAGPGNSYTPGAFLQTPSTIRIMEFFRDEPPLAPDSARIGPPIRLAITQESRDSIQVYDGNGSGGFGPARSYATGQAPSPFFSPFLVADMDDDGFADLVYAKDDIGAVLRGAFTGRFGTAQEITTTGAGPTADLALLTGNDQQIDLIVANEDNDYLQLYRGNQGVFTPVDSMLIGDGPAFVRAADLDNDGGPLDLVVAVRNKSVIATLKNTPSNGFFGPTYSPCGLAPSRFEVLRLNNDDQPDVAVIGTPQNRIVFMGGDGTEFFVEQTVVLGPAEAVRAIVAGDIDNDGDDDLIAAEVGGKVFLFRNNSGVMTQETISTSLAGTESMVLEDIDLDGDSDIVMATGSNALLFMRNLGAGTFGPFAEGVVGNFFAAGVIAADVSGDGRNDLITLGGVSLSQIAVNIGPPSGPIRQGALQYPMADKPSSLLAADLDGDGLADLVSVSRDARTVTVLRSSGGCPGPCTPDLASPFGTINFFDLAAYLALYNAGNPAADLAAPSGTLNFFDLAAYLASYNAGCP